MKIKIIVENKRKKRVEISISQRELRDVYDGMYICMDDKRINHKFLKINKVM